MSDIEVKRVFYLLGSLEGYAEMIDCGVFATKKNDTNKLLKKRILSVALELELALKEAENGK